MNDVSMREKGGQEMIITSALLNFLHKKGSQKILLSGKEKQSRLPAPGVETLPGRMCSGSGQKDRITFKWSILSDSLSLG